MIAPNAKTPFKSPEFVHGLKAHHALLGTPAQFNLSMSVSSLASTPGTPLVAPKEPSCFEKFFTNRQVVTIALFIVNAVAIGNAISPLALAITNFVLLSLACYIFPKSLHESIQGKTKIAVLTVGYTAIAGLTAMNIITILGMLSVQTVGWTLCGVIMGQVAIPILMPHIPGICKKRYPCCYAPSESDDPMSRSVLLPSRELNLEGSPQLPQ